MPLGVVKSELLASEMVVDLAGDKALGAEGFFFGAPLLHAPVDVGPGVGITDYAGHDDAPQRRVGLAVTAAVEPVPFLFA